MPDILRDCTKRIVDYYNPKRSRFYGHVHGFLCFGYEECGQFDLAEKHGKMSMEFMPNDVMTNHAMAHLFEETHMFILNLLLLLN